MTQATYRERQTRLMRDRRNDPPENEKGTGREIPRFTAGADLRSVKDKGLTDKGVTDKGVTDGVTPVASVRGYSICFECTSSLSGTC